MKINKTNVARLLDKAKVAYQLVPYEVDENDLSATHVADQLGENVAQVFKSCLTNATFVVGEGNNLCVMFHNCVIFLYKDIIK